MKSGRYLYFLLSLLVLAACQGANPVNDRLSALEGTMAAVIADNQTQATAIAQQSELISYLATRGPFAITPIPAGSTPTPYRPVQGALEVEEGRCCIGGLAGETIELRLQMNAQSPTGEVTQMRVRLSGSPLDEAQMETVPWEPFMREKMLPLQVALNWVGYTVSVQFRDEAGSLSPIYSAEIAVEGSPGQE